MKAWYRVQRGFTLIELLLVVSISSIISIASVLYVTRAHRDVSDRSALIELAAEADRVHEWLARDAAIGEAVTVRADRRSLTIELLGEGQASYSLAGSTLTRFGPLSAGAEATTLVLSTRVARWDVRPVPQCIDTSLSLEQPAESEILRHVSQMAAPMALSGGATR